MSHPSGIIPFVAFLDSVSASTFDRFDGDRASRVRDEYEFAAMRSHILALYAGVSAEHAFVDEFGGIFDCIPFEQQPSLRNSDGKSISPAPDLPIDDHFDSVPSQRRAADLVDAPFGPGRIDRFGNAMNCPDGRIRMRRTSLADVTRFETLEGFLRKGPRPPHRSVAPTRQQDASLTHQWAVGQQQVDNNGGQSMLSLANRP